ncbi:MAG: hypothetical protein ABEK50_05860, partial [bacterium]
IQFNRRDDRLRTVNVYEVRKQDEISPKSAPIEPEVGNLLFPEPEVYLPLLETLTPRQEWGPPIRNWKLRVEQPPLQSAPESMGPR